MTTPILPGIASVATFGGNAMVNHDTVENPETEVDASFWNLMVTQLTMMGYTVPRAWCKASVSGAPALVVTTHRAVWGNAEAVKPTPNRVSAGVYTLTWATTYDDLQAESETHATSFIDVIARAYNGASFIGCTAAVTASNVVTIRTFDAAGVATDCTELSVCVL